MAIYHYANHGDDFKNICSEVKRAMKFRPADWDEVIAYLDNRDEFEILQNKSVEDVVEIPMEKPSDEFIR